MRREIEVTVVQEKDARENRDAGKTFVVIEVSAVQAEEWGLRALMALGSSGIVVPQEIADAGLIGIALIGYQALMGAEEKTILPLWREMLPACVKYQPSPGIRMPYDASLIEEVSTLVTLRKQIMELHVGFTLAEIALMLRRAVSAKVSASLTTETSPES